MRHNAIRLCALPIALLVVHITSGCGPSEQQAESTDDPHVLEAQSAFDAARAGDVAAVRELLADEPDLVGQTDERGRTLRA